MKNGFSVLAILGLLFGSVLLVPGAGIGETVSFPLQLDYPFLGNLVTQTAFTGPGRTMVVTDPDNDCQQITLSNPVFASENNLLRVDVAVQLKGGALIGENCLFPMEWDGYLVAHLKPRMNSGKWTLAFDPVDSVLLDKNRRPDTMMGHLWNLFEAPVMARIGSIHIAVDDPIEQLDPFLLSIVPEADYPRMAAVLASLRPGAVAAGPKGLRIQVVTDIDPGSALEPPSAATPLIPEEIDAFIEIWETWDAFLVQTLMTLLDMPLTDQERGTMLTVLLDTRYRFAAELAANAPTSSGDFVREQFVMAWETLSPILKHHLSRLKAPRSGQPYANSWGVLAFFTASDALSALDKLGPVLNIEISKNGLIRLARMLSENKTLTLEYSLADDPGLRKLLGLRPVPETTFPADTEALPEPENQTPGPKTENLPTFLQIRQLIVTGLFRALAPKDCRAEKSWSHPSLQEMRPWLVTRDTVDTHLKKVKPLLEAATRENLKKDSIPESHRRMFQHAVMATAWQESCFRQFIVDNRKLVYIRSYNNSSVGMMQINERVWRGMYNIERLRWDIRYNAAAGIDILNLYLRKYALPKMKSLKGKEALDNDGVAGSLYAMYNAGPGGFSRYVKRRSTGKFSKIDAHFKEKYIWVKIGQWDRLRDCF